MLSISLWNFLFAFRRLFLSFFVFHVFYTICVDSRLAGKDSEPFSHLVEGEQCSKTLFGLHGYRIQTPAVEVTCATCVAGILFSGDFSRSWLTLWVCLSGRRPWTVQGPGFILSGLVCFLLDVCPSRSRMRFRGDPGAVVFWAVSCAVVFWAAFGVYAFVFQIYPWWRRYFEWWVAHYWRLVLKDNHEGQGSCLQLLRRHFSWGHPLTLHYHNCLGLFFLSHLILLSLGHVLRWSSTAARVQHLPWPIWTFLPTFVERSSVAIPNSGSRVVHGLGHGSESPSWAVHGPGHGCGSFSPLGGSVRWVMRLGLAMYIYWASLSKTVVSAIIIRWALLSMSAKFNSWTEMVWVPCSRALLQETSPSTMYHRLSEQIIFLRATQSRFRARSTWTISTVACYDDSPWLGPLYFIWITSIWARQSLAPNIWPRPDKPAFVRDPPPFAWPTFQVTYPLFLLFLAHPLPLSVCRLSPSSPHAKPVLRSRYASPVYYLKTRHASPDYYFKTSPPHFVSLLFCARSIRISFCALAIISKPTSSSCDMDYELLSAMEHLNFTTKETATVITETTTADVDTSTWLVGPQRRTGIEYFAEDATPVDAASKHPVDATPVHTQANHQPCPTAPTPRHAANTQGNQTGVTPVEASKGYTAHSHENLAGVTSVEAPKDPAATSNTIGTAEISIEGSNGNGLRSTRMTPVVYTAVGSNVAPIDIVTRTDSVTTDTSSPPQAAHLSSVVSTLASQQPAGVVDIKGTFQFAAPPVHDSLVDPQQAKIDERPSLVVRLSTPVMSNATSPTRVSKRSLQGKYEVCTPIQPKRSRLSSSSGSENKHAGMSSLNSSTEVAEVAGQLRRAS
ncbi:hypothetical protein V6N11_056297 [Hibiscus sabdariffa]|uniref:Uncharacterized protein n=1 Tax=Hibiscus sabdariffa TaxID=183260 RepID=A0ABR2T3Q9_9ROSI